MRVTRDGERRWALAFIVAAASSCGDASGDANGVGGERPTGVVEAEDVRVEERPCMWAGEGPRSWDLDEGLRSSEMAGAVIEWVRGMHCSEHEEARLIEAVEQVGSYDVNDSALAERVRARAPECLAAVRASVLVDQVVASRFCPLADNAYVPIGRRWSQYLGLWNLRQELEATTVVLPPDSDANYTLEVQYVVWAVAATTPFSWGTGGFSSAEATAADYLVALDAWSRRWRAPGVTPERIQVICDAVRGPGGHRPGRRWWPRAVEPDRRAITVAPRRVRHAAVRE